MRLLLFTLLLSTLSFGQDRNGISYQALIINPNVEQLPGQDNHHAPLTNTDICFQFHIINSSGNYEYSESQSVTTDAYGMVNLVIGTGLPIGAITWEAVAWSAEAKSLKVDLDITGACTSFTELSNQQLTSVPFALYSPASNTPGPKGDPGDPGADGDSAYQVWLDAGNTGTEQEFLDSLKGTDGTPGADGDSAYQVWLDAGNTGTEQEFLDSLKGADGDPGEGTEGKSAYDIWIELGNTGSEQDFIDSLVGPQGEPGTSGTSTGGVSEFGCYNIQPVFNEYGRGGLQPSSFNNLDTNPTTEGDITHLQENLKSKHIRLNVSIEMGNTEKRTLKLTAFDSNDNRIICYFDVSKIINELNTESNGITRGHDFSSDLSRNGVFFTDELSHYNGSFLSLSSYLYNIDVFSHSNEISKILFEYQTPSPSSASITNFQIFEYKCETPEFSINYTPLETTVDFNGQNWGLVQLGTQQWTQNNLDVASYTDGTPIPQFTGTNAEWAALTTGAWRYFNDDSNYAYLGKLYNSYAVHGIHDDDSNTPNKVLAPDGYRVPTQEDIQQLSSFLINNGFNSNGSFSGNLSSLSLNHLSKSLATQDNLWNTNFGTNVLWPNTNLSENNSSKLDFKPYYYGNSWAEGYGAYYWLFSIEGKKIIYGIRSNYTGLTLYDTTNSNDSRAHFVRLLKE